MRARGLKPLLCLAKVYIDLSRPMRARGLKLQGYVVNLLKVKVAPHAGAWIETY